MALLLSEVLADAMLQILAQMAEPPEQARTRRAGETADVNPEVAPRECLDRRRR